MDRRINPHSEGHGDGGCPEIESNGSVEYKVILGHNTHLLTQAMQCYFLQIITVNIDIAFLNIIETADKVYDCSFSCASWSNYRYLLTSFKLSCKIFYY